MGLLSDFVDTFEDTAGYIAGGIVPGYLMEKQKQAQEEQKKLVNEQVAAYKEQTALTREELNRKQGEIKAEKRRVEEKQIRNLRRNYSTRGLLNYQNQQASSGATPAQADVSNKLGT